MKQLVTFLVVFTYLLEIEAQQAQDINPVLKCEGCIAVVSEVNKILVRPSKQSIQSRVADSLQRLCEIDNLRTYKFSPPKMVKACNYLLQNHKQDLLPVFIENYADTTSLDFDTLLDDICWTRTKLCHGFTKKAEEKKEADVLLNQAAEQVLLRQEGDTYVLETSLIDENNPDSNPNPLVEEEVEDPLDEVVEETKSKPKEVKEKTKVKKPKIVEKQTTPQGKQGKNQKQDKHTKQKDVQKEKKVKAKEVQPEENQEADIKVQESKGKQDIKSQKEKTKSNKNKNEETTKQNQDGKIKKQKQPKQEPAQEQESAINKEETQTQEKQSKNKNKEKPLKSKPKEQVEKNKNKQDQENLKSKSKDKLGKEQKGKKGGKTAKEEL